MTTTTVDDPPSDLVVDFEAEFIGEFAHERKARRAAVRPGSTSLWVDVAVGRRRTGAS
ncbi:hypothetical protein [Rhodococcus gannanensis]|uniref:Transposase n=1 Tax=Rhodococcus gannanensis TaxID=1960308 RepID=A0ABW4P244_9NOCA